MIRFSHEANNGSGSWQFFTQFNDVGWVNVSVEDARYFVDRGAYIQLT